MHPKQIYIVRTGCLNSATNMFNLSDYYFSSKKKAFKYKDDILKINQATDVVDNFKFDNQLFNVDYIGEDGKYKARVVIEQHRLD